jgi:hypothetical protein
VAQKDHPKKPKTQKYKRKKPRNTTERTGLEGQKLKIIKKRGKAKAKKLKININTFEKPKTGT